MNPAEIADGVREGMEAEREPVAEKRVLIDEDAELPENPFHITLGTAKLAPFEHGIQHGRREGYERCKKDVKAAGWRKVKEARE